MTVADAPARTRNVLPRADLRPAPRVRGRRRGRVPRADGTGSHGSDRAGTERAYWPGLDGLRAVAVTVVLLYHAGVQALPGGLLGVDVFFVLSGFLITGLLLDERVRTGSIRLGAFWSGRARRLLPALVLVLLTVVGCAGLFNDGGGVVRLRDDALASLFYVANWRFAYSGQGYFDRFADPSPLLHLWSLGVEEQFYLLWPLLVLLLVRFAVRPARFVGIIAVLLTAASTTLLVVLHAHGAGADRLYYGTDTRALALLTGGLLACTLSARRGRHRRASGTTRLTRFVLAAAGLVGAGVLGVAFGFVDGQDRRLYEGGFLLVAMAAAAVVASVVVAPGAPLSRLLALPPLVAVGRISYGLYLWHWPLFLLLDAERTRHTGAALLAIRLGATLLVATVSYLAVERPIRSGRWTRPRLRIAAPLVTVGTAAAVVLATLPGLLPDRSSAQPTDLSSVASSEFQERQRLLASQAPPARPATEPVRVLVVGDSIGLTAAAALRRVQSQWKVETLNAGVAACGIAPGNRLAGSPDISLPDHRPCGGWPQWWQDAVSRFRPDVVLLLSGRWETGDRFFGPTPNHIGTPRFDQLLSRAFDDGIRILSARGAKVGLVTTPCAKLRERADGSPDPLSSPDRVASYNRLLTAAAARHQDSARVIDLFGQLCPGGQYSRSVDGVTARNVDGVHLDLSSGAVLAPLLFGTARSMVGLPAQPAAGTPGAAPAGASPGAAPAGG